MTKEFTTHIVYEEKTGEIMSIYTIYEMKNKLFCREDEKKILERIKKYIPTGVAANVISSSNVDIQELDKMRVNPKTKELEKWG